MRRSPSQIVSGVGRRSRAAASAAWGAATGRGESRSDASVDQRTGDDWWDLLPFTGHRIELAPGLWTTRPEAGVEVWRDVRLDYATDACGGSLDGKTVVDLGCLEGGFTFEFAARGASRALGIEARSVNVRRCQLAADLRSDDNVEFIEADVNTDLTQVGDHDVVFASGILYHVADPSALLTSIRGICKHVAVICTHVAHPTSNSHGCSELVTRTLATGDYQGRMYREWDDDSTAQRDSWLWASWTDSVSFWPLEDELVRMLSDCGFARVQKVDPVADGFGGRWGVDQTNRVLYLAWPHQS